MIVECYAYFNRHWFISLSRYVYMGQNNIICVRRRYICKFQTCSKDWGICSRLNVPIDIGVWKSISTPCTRSGSGRRISFAGSAFRSRDSALSRICSDILGVIIGRLTKRRKLRRCKRYLRRRWSLRQSSSSSSKRKWRSKCFPGSYTADWVFSPLLLLQYN